MTSHQFQYREFWKKKSIELAQKCGERQVALDLPDFHSIDSAFFCKKAKLLPTLPKSLLDLTDLPQTYKPKKMKIFWLVKYLLFQF